MECMLHRGENKTNQTHSTRKALRARTGKYWIHIVHINSSRLYWHYYVHQKEPSDDCMMHGQTFFFCSSFHSVSLPSVALACGELVLTDWDCNWFLNRVLPTSWQRLKPPPRTSNYCFYSVYTHMVICISVQSQCNFVLRAWPTYTHGRLRFAFVWSEFVCFLINSYYINFPNPI
jgi:hypothetical protein